MFRAMERDRHGSPNWLLLRDGSKLASMAWIGPVSLSPSDGTPAFWSCKSGVHEPEGPELGESLRLMFGKKESGQWLETDADAPPVYFPDGKTVLSIASNDGTWVAVSLTSRGKEKKHGGGLVVGVAANPAGGELACTSLDLSAGMPEPDEPHHFIVTRFSLDERGYKANLETLGYSYDSAGSTVYSGDGTRLAYKVVIDEKMGVDIGAQEDAACTLNFLDELTFSPDGKELAYVACLGGHVDERNGIEVLERKVATEGRWIAVWGAQRSDEHEWTRLPT